MRFLYLLLLLVTTNALATRQETISADCLKIQDGVCITKTELGNVSGSTSNIQTQINANTTSIAAKADDTAVVHKSGTETITGDKLVTGQLTATSTTKGNRPCPAMNSTQMNAVVSPSSGDCVFNTTLGKLNIYDGTAWKSAGGGVSKWATATAYLTDDVVVSSNKLYIALSGHTSGTFATDLGTGKWLLLKAAVDVSTDASGVLPLANGGTNKNMTVVNGGVVYTDADSQEVSAAGTSGQVLQSAGAGTPIWVNKSISGKAEGGTSQTVEEVQVPNNLLTQTGTNKYLHETGNNNLLANPSFEHSTATTGWTVSGGVTALAETTIVRHGKQSLFLSPGSLALDLYQDSALNQAQLADGGQAFASMWVKTSVTTPAMYVCPRQAGAYPPSMSGGCKQVVGDGKWHFYEIAFNLGGTSNGIGLTSNGVGVSGVIYVDKAISEPSTARQALSPVGPMVSYGAINITATTTAPTKATTREKDDVSCRINGQYYECIYEYRAASATGSAVGSGGYIFNLPSGIAMDTNYQYTTTNRATFNSYDGLRAAASIGFGDVEYSVNGDTGTKCDVYATSSTTFQVNCWFGGTNNWMISSGEAPVINQTNAGMKFQIRFRGAGLSSNYSAYSTNDYPFTTDSAPLAFASSASYTISNLNTAPVGTFITYSYASSTNTRTQCTTAPTQTTADMNTNGIQLFTRAYNAASTCASPAVVAINLGTGYDSVSPTIYKSTGKSTSGTLTHSIESAVEYGSFVQGFNPSNGVYLYDLGYNFQSTTTVHNIVFSDGTPSSSGYLTVTGNKSKSTTIGQFNGLESCTDSFQCETEYTAKISSSCAVTDQTPAQWINTCTLSGTSDCICTHVTGKFTSTPNYTASSQSTTNEVDRHISIYNASASGFSSKARNGANADTASPLTIKAFKTGTDYVAKSARAVASDQNIATPGVTKAVVFGATINNTTLTNNEGGFITSSLCSSGSYTVNLTGLASVSRCNATVQDAGVLPLSPFNFVKSSSSVTFKTSNNSGTGVCYTVDLTCNGVKQ